jgi:TRAP-type C4-dicarboxylate transport system substrate-binding protein
MKQLVRLVRWLREPTKSMRRHKEMEPEQMSGLHLSNVQKDILQLCFSKMGLSSVPAPNAIVADRMEVEI